jgi:hypothetical protein
MVPPLADDDSLRKLFELNPSSPNALVSLDELHQAQQAVLATPVAPDACEAMIAIKHGLEDEGIAASDRRWRSCAKLIRAKAWLAGDSQATVEHCEVLVHALWSDPSELRVVERVVSRVANPLNLEAVELEDAAKDLYDQRPSPDHANLTQALEPILRQLADIHTRLEQRMSGVPDRRSSRARLALGRVESYHRALSELALRSLSRMHLAPGAA